ncbi:hypothetical protein HJG60_012255 [Phyllostomus discolor]|uniref:Uncharacterized protein n=1 Tax=Phyllostomus discolor TaxID=89673 RepID=A0A833ZDN3_9CHIR|nr:hypothetical protein HJG60_012255 [Phyllostomus discolor]
MLRFSARSSPNATVPGHAPPERVTPDDSPAHLALINPDAAPAVPQPIGTSPYLHTTLNVSKQRHSRKLTFGFIVPRTLQMEDLVNTCRTQVPHLPRLLPFPTLKSWVAVITLKGVPTPRFQKDW